MDIQDEENIIIYRDRDGKQNKAYKLFSFEHDDKNYIVFTDGKKNKNNIYELNACIYDPTGADLHFYPVTSEFEWKMIKEVYKNIKDYVDELMSRKVVDKDE